MSKKVNVFINVVQLVKMVLLCAMFFLISCGNDEKEEDKKDGVMFLDSEFGGNATTIRMAGSGTVAIDWWGNGEVETYTLSAFETERALESDAKYSYSHSSADTHITITGENITHLNCSGSFLNLNVRENPALTHLYCYCNKLYFLSLNENITFMRLGFTQVEHLMLYHCKALKELYCYGNSKIYNFDLIENKELITLWCTGSQLGILDVSKNPNLHTLNISSNAMDAEGLNYTFNTLSPVNDKPKFIYIDNNPGTDDCDISIATKKGWTIRESFRPD